MSGTIRDPLKIVVFHNGRLHTAASPLGGASVQMTMPLGD